VIHHHSRSKLWLLLGLLVALPAAADVPDPAQCIVPDLLTLVARDGGGNVDSGYPYTVVLKKFSGQPYRNGTVVIDFTNCPDLRICTDQGDPNTFVYCDAIVRTVRASSDINGRVTFHVAGGATNAGASPGPTAPAVNVYADGVFLKTVRAAALDQQGSNGVDGGDQSTWLADHFSGQSFARSDYDGDGMLSGNDLSLWLLAFFGGASAVGCGIATCP
jgi:hypothetical protein